MSDFFNLTFWDILVFALIFWESYQTHRFAQSLMRWQAFHQQTHDAIVAWSGTITEMVAEQHDGD